MIKLGIFMNFWENNWQADHIKYINKAADIGFNVLEFQAQPLLEISDEKLSKIKQTALERNIELTYSLGLDKKYDISSDDETTREEGIKYLISIMKRVAFMDGKLISGVSYAGWGIPSNPVIDKKKLTHNSVKSMKNISKVAEDLGIIYGVEAVNRYEGVVLNTSEDAVNYVKLVDSKNVRVLLDTYHMNIEESSIGNAIRKAGNLLIGLHTGENNRAAPGRGHLNWDEIFSALHDINFKGRIISEPFVKKGGQVGRDIYVWKDLIPDTSENYIDSEAKFLLDFKIKMLKKFSIA